MDLNEAVVKGAELLTGNRPAIVLSGAGISVGSGIPPFRGPGGLWERYDPEDHGHMDTFRSDPERCWTMLRDLIGTSLGASPNGAHLALARLEKRGVIAQVITQNVDGLHQAAGSGDVIELHGNARRIYCPSCGSKEYLEEFGSFSPICECGSWKRPDIVFFGEALPERDLERAFTISGTSGAILVVGTSGLVHPAAMIPEVVKKNGGKVIEINPQPSAYFGSITDILIRSKASTGMVALEEAIMDILE